MPDSAVPARSRRVRRCIVWSLCGASAVAMAVAAWSSCGLHEVAGPWREDITRAPGAALEEVAVEDGGKYRWERRATLAGGSKQICDITSSQGGLLVAASRSALEENGAAICRLTESGEVETLLEWSGQGFLRAHVHGTRLVVPDADAPFSVIQFAFRWHVDGYVFISDERGILDQASRETLPAVYHVFDTARLREGRLVASAGAYPAGETAYFSDHAPAALFVDGCRGEPWHRVLEYPGSEAHGVSRFTYLQPLDDGSVLAGVQTSRSDLPAAVRISGLPDAPAVEPVRGLDGETLRWASWRGAVYHVAQGQDTTVLSISRDGGMSFSELRVPEPQSLAPARDALFLLAGGALWKSLDGETFFPVAPAHPSLAHEPSTLVSAPLAAHLGRLFAGSPRTGEVLELVRS